MLGSLGGKRLIFWNLQLLGLTYFRGKGEGIRVTGCTDKKKYFVLAGHILRGRHGPAEDRYPSKEKEGKLMNE